MERTEGGGLGRSRKELRIGLRSAGQAQVKVKASTEALFAEHIDQGPPFFFFFWLPQVLCAGRRKASILTEVLFVY